VVGVGFEVLAERMCFGVRVKGGCRAVGVCLGLLCWLPVELLGILDLEMLVLRVEVLGMLL
jgi:hypothetical protein